MESGWQFYISDSLLLDIFEYLDICDLGRASQVCKTWCRVCGDEILWHSLARRTWKLKGPLLSQCISWKEEVKRLFYHVPLVETHCIEKHTDEVLDVAISHDGKYFCTVSKDSTIVMWDLANPTDCISEVNTANDFNWMLTQYSVFNEDDTQVFVCGVRNLTPEQEDDEPIGCGAIFSVPDLHLIGMIFLEPFTLFGAWLDDRMFIAGLCGQDRIFMRAYSSKGTTKQGDLSVKDHAESLLQHYAHNQTGLFSYWGSRLHQMNVITARVPKTHSESSLLYIHGFRNGRHQRNMAGVQGSQKLNAYHDEMNGGSRTDKSEAVNFDNNKFVDAKFDNIDADRADFDQRGCANSAPSKVNEVNNETVEASCDINVISGAVHQALTAQDDLFENVPSRDDISAFQQKTGNCSLKQAVVTRSLLKSEDMGVRSEVEMESECDYSINLPCDIDKGNMISDPNRLQDFQENGNKFPFENRSNNKEVDIESTSFTTVQDETNERHNICNDSKDSGFKRYVMLVAGEHDAILLFEVTEAKVEDLRKQFDSGTYYEDEGFVSPDYLFHIEDSYITGLSLSADNRFAYFNHRAVCHKDPEEENNDDDNDDVDPLDPVYSSELKIGVIDLVTMQRVKDIEYKGHIGYSNHSPWYICLDISQDFILSGSEDGSSYIWEKNYNTCLGTLKHTEGVVNGVAFSPVDQETCVTVCDDQLIKVWRSRNRKREMELMKR